MSETGRSTGQGAAAIPPVFRRLPGEPPADHARRLWSRGPGADDPGRWGLATQAGRRLAQRLGRHQSNFQRALDQALLDALADQQAGLASAVSAQASSCDRTSDQVAGLASRLTEMEVALAWEEAEGARGRPEAEGWRRRLAGLFSPGDTREPPAVVDLATDVGDLLYPATDQVVTPFVREHGYWESEEAAMLRSLLRPGMTFVDIGAHVGYLTLVAAGAVGRGGRGVAVEPAPANFALLSANLRRRGATQVEAVQAAAWDTSGTVALTLSSDNSGDHRASASPGAAYADGSATASGPPGRAITVAAVALDDLLPSGARVDVAKVDTQGTDHRAVQGMAKVLAASRTVLLVEFWPPGVRELGEDPLAVLRTYDDLGYEAQVLGVPRTTPPPSPAQVMEAAARAPGRYCTLVQTPT